VTEFSLHADLQLARALADMADAISMDRFRANDLAVAMKPDMTHVTDADKAVEAAIRGALHDSRPADSVLGEEAGEQAGAEGSHRQWIIDPIDGTANYVRGVPIWASLISLAVDGVPVVGVVSAPALGKRWWGATGLGAFVDETIGSTLSHSQRRIHVSQVAKLSDASMSLSAVNGWDAAGRLDQFIALSRVVWRNRDYGDMWPYMMVAEGLVDIAGEFDLKPWDMSALIPIVQEAGGRFTSADGQDGPWNGSAIATNGQLHPLVLDAVRAD
jgi:histidinol-phosphatase